MIITTTTLAAADDAMPKKQRVPQNAFHSEYLRGSQTWMEVCTRRLDAKGKLDGQTDVRRGSKGLQERLCHSDWCDRQLDHDHHSCFGASGSTVTGMLWTRVMVTVLVNGHASAETQ